MDQLRKVLFLSQFSLLICLLISSLIVPSVVIKEGGVSNFGNHLSTLAFYTLGFLLNMAFLYIAADIILKSSIKLKNVSLSLKFLCFLTLLVYLSTFPRHFSFTFSDIHDYIGIALFCYQILISSWIIRIHRSYKTAIWFALELVGSLVGLLSIIKVIDWLYLGQIIGALGFALILVLALPDAIEEIKTR